MRLAVALLSVVTLNVCAAAVSLATDIVVTITAGSTGGPECTLRDAITAANSDLPAGGCPAGSGADTIVLAPGATYLLDTIDNTTQENGNVQPNGLPSITSAVTITGNGTTIARFIAKPGHQSTTGQTPSFRLLHVAPGGVLTLSGLTLTGGLSPADVNAQETVFSGGNGGAIFNEGTLVLTQTQVTANEAAGSGGGIYNAAGATAHLAESAVSGNQAGLCAATLGVCPGIDGREIPGDGGGIANDGIMTANDTVLNGNYGSDAGAIRNTGRIALDRCTVSANASYGYVGGLDNFGSATLVDSTFSGNGSGCPYYAAIQNEASGNISLTNCVLADNNGELTGGINNLGTAVLTNCTLRNNVGSDGGGSCGAIANYGGTMKLTGCTITGNFGFSEGGIGNGPSGTVEMADCTLSANSASGGGGAIGNGGTLTMTNCTITGNNSDSGAAGIDNGGPVGGTSVIDNCIIAGNASFVGPGNCAGPILGTGHNLTTDDTCGSRPDLVVTDAGVAPLGNYGGPTETMALCTAAGAPDASCTGPSPAIDAGDPDLCVMPPVNGRDQRGFARPGMGHARCSLGAFEADAVPAQVCIGDCSGAATVAISDLVTLVNIALGSALPAACAYGVPSGSDVSVALLIQAVNNALSGCRIG